MEKFLALDGSHSFPRNHETKKNANAGHSRHASENLYKKSDRQKKGIETEGDRHGSQLSSSAPELNIPQILEDVDRYIDTLSSSGDDLDSNPAKVTKSVDSLYKMVESVIIKYESKATFGQNQEEVDSFSESLKRVSKMMNKMGEFSSNSTMSSALNKASVVLHRAMFFLDEEFRVHLESKRLVLDTKTPKTPKQSSFSISSHSSHESDRCLLENESQENEEFPYFSAEAISNMNKFATAMISAGYEVECCMLYNAFRRNAIKEELDKLGFDSITIDDVHRMQWETLEVEITSCISIFNHCFTVLFSGERKLSDSIFSEYPSISQKLFSDLATAVITLFLSFAEAVALTKRSTERLFKFLDMFESLSELTSSIDDSYSRECVTDLMVEISAVKSHLAEAAASIFCELENSIKCDQGRTPVPSGQVHPLTRYTMNYLKYACEYKETLEEVFKLHQKDEGFNIQANELNHLDVNENVSEGANDDGTPKKSPFAIELISVMDLLDANLDMKSKLYRDPALRYIFLMNNGRYILQKIQGSTEIHNMMGVTWCRKRSTDLRQYHKNYQRETWSKVLQCISHEGLQSNGKIIKTVLKERFKNFNVLFDEIHRTQSTWVVSDEQLQSELRVSISAVVIPAYRSFLGRYKQYLENRNSDKYFKYQPEDIETLIDELFDGNPMSMGRRRN